MARSASELAQAARSLYGAVRIVDELDLDGHEVLLAGDELEGGQLGRLQHVGQRGAADERVVDAVLDGTGETPTPLLALPCGSRSMSSVRRSAAATLAARFTAVVVLPTPPFWLTTAMTESASLHRGDLL